jgi:hypothetical protein
MIAREIHDSGALGVTFDTLTELWRLQYVTKELGINAIGFRTDHCAERADAPPPSLTKLRQSPNRSFAAARHCDHDVERTQQLFWLGK